VAFSIECCSGVRLCPLPLRLLAVLALVVCNDSTHRHHQTVAGRTSLPQPSTRPACALVATGFQPHRVGGEEPRQNVPHADCRARLSPLASLFCPCALLARCDPPDCHVACGPECMFPVPCACCMSCSCMSCMSCIRAAGRCLAGRLSVALHVRSPAIARARAIAPLVSLASSTPTVTCEAVCCRWLAYSRIHMCLRRCSCRVLLKFKLQKHLVRAHSSNSSNRANPNSTVNSGAVWQRDAPAWDGHRSSGYVATRQISCEYTIRGVQVTSSRTVDTPTAELSTHLLDPASLSELFKTPAAAGPRVRADPQNHRKADMTSECRTNIRYCVNKSLSRRLDTRGALRQTITAAAAHKFALTRSLRP
jgi:hypothetical protein